MAITFDEYRSENSHRKYPFKDDALLVDTESRPLPVDFILDAILYPIDLENGLYLSEIDIANLRLTFSDTVTNQIHGIATLTSLNDTIAEVYDIIVPDRQIGTLVFGAGLPDISVGVTRTFTPAGTELTPAAYIPLNQKGVRGIILEDGTIITGHIIFEGQDGIRITGSTAGGISTIRIDAIGAVTSTESCTELCESISQLCIDQIENSRFNVSDCGDPDLGTICILGCNFSLADICEDKLQGLSTPADEIECPPATSTPEPVELCGEFFGCINPVNNGYYIIAPADMDYANPINISMVDPLSEYQETALRNVLSETALIDKSGVAQSTPAAGLKFNIRGLNKNA